MNGNEKGINEIPQPKYVIENATQDGSNVVVPLIVNDKEVIARCVALINDGKVTLHGVTIDPVEGIVVEKSDDIEKLIELLTKQHETAQKPKLVEEPESVGASQIEDAER